MSLTQKTLMDLFQLRMYAKRTIDQEGGPFHKEEIYRYAFIRSTDEASELISSSNGTASLINTDEVS